MVGRSVFLACFLAGSSAAFAVQQPVAPTFAARSSIIHKSNVLNMAGGEAELSVRLFVFSLTKLMHYFCV